MILPSRRLHGRFVKKWLIKFDPFRWNYMKMILWKYDLNIGIAQARSHLRFTSDYIAFEFFNGFTTWKSSNKMLPQWVLNLGPQSFGYDAHLSELLRHLLLAKSEICIYMVMLYWLYLNDPRLKWCRNKRQFKDIASSTCLDSSESRALDLNGWGPRFNTHRSDILLLDFLFSRIKSFVPMLPIRCVCENSIVCCRLYED